MRKSSVLSGALFLTIASLPYISMVCKPRPATESHGQRETLLIVSPHRREVRQEYDRGFREWMQARHQRNVRIQWLDAGGTSKILKDLESRFATSPGSPGVDLMFGGGVAPFITAMGLGWLTPVQLPQDQMEGIPALCAGAPVYDPDHHWFGVALSGFGIVYNRLLIDRMNLPIPNTWEDLGRPEFQSWIASGDPRSSGAVHMCYEIILQACGFEEGWRLITRLCANVRRFGEGGGVAPMEVASGDVAAGMAIDQYAQTVIDSAGADMLAFVLPEGATAISADSIAMLQGAPSPELSRLFIEYVLSEEGQRLLFQPAGVNGQKYALHRLPVRQSLYQGTPAPATNPYDQQTPFVYDESLGSRRWKLVNDLIGTCLIDAHADLTAAWKRIIAAGSPEHLVEKFCEPPVTQEEMNALMATWNDPRIRLDVMNQWARQARTRYQNLR